MKAFAQLYENLDQTTSTNEKIMFMVNYFQKASDADAAWALFFLTGQRFKRFISSRQLREWFLTATRTPEWLFVESYSAVGDTAETIALMWDTLVAHQPESAPLSDTIDSGISEAPPEKSAATTLKLPGFEGHPLLADTDDSLTVWIEDRILPLQTADEAQRARTVVDWWRVLGRRELYVVNKLLTGAFRVGVSQTLVVKALAQVTGQTVATVTHHLTGHWKPTAAFMRGLSDAATAIQDDSKPYPFSLAYPLEASPETLGTLEDWLIEWKWDGIRSQLVRRNGVTYLWSRGDELITERFPEVMEGSRFLPDGTVLDGEILAYSDGRPLPFSALQTRIGRKKLTPRALQEAPVIFCAYDALEIGGKDFREEPLRDRRSALTDVIAQAPVGAPYAISEALQATDWNALATLREESRSRFVEGFMLKRLSSSYFTGRKKGDWWKWKIDPYTIDAVLLYAQVGSGRRANLFTDYTFGLWDGGSLVPVAKAYSGLSNEEIGKLDRWIRTHTIERFGPVRSVPAEKVFELAFEGIALSARHKSGVATRFPRILRQRDDKPAAEANTLDDLKALIVLPETVKGLSSNDLMNFEQPDADIPQKTTPRKRKAKTVASEIIDPAESVE